jgi:hypothetical protein
LAATLIWIAFTESVFKACMLAAMCTMPIAPIVWFAARRLNCQCRELERRLADFDVGRLPSMGCAVSQKENLSN